ncbi:MAG: glycosyltransferase family 2 protein [Patescibacteria group bacterium]|nr:glycosyltransferase family 2 protein [Patescibacteria group bacterium]
MDVSIIILNYKSSGLARQCIKSIVAAAPKLEYEIIVVDNNSHDGIGRMLREQFPQVKFIQSSRNAGFAAGNNIGLRVATGRYAMIVNPDIIVNPGTLEEMVKEMDAHPEIGLLAPQLLNPDKTIQYSCYRLPTFGIPFYRRTPLGLTPRGKRMIRSYLMAEWDHAAPREIDWCVAACIMVRRSAVECVGYFDERYFMYFEDADWCRRFHQAGFRVVYFPRAKMFHYHIRQSADVPWFMGLFQKISRIHMASALKYFWKWKGKE